MKNRISLLVAAWFGCVGIAVAQGDKSASKPQAAPRTIRVTTDRPEALYRVGETATFRAQLLVGGKDGESVEAKYVLSNDGFKEIARGTCTLGSTPFAVTGTLTEPGILLCQFTVESGKGKRRDGFAGAAFDPLQIKPSLAPPDDFDAFWAEQKKQLAAVPQNPKLTAVPHENAKIECFDVRVDCLGGRPVSGYFARPKVAAAKSLPAVLHVHGAGVLSAQLGPAASDAAKGRLGMDINAHGIANGKPGSYYAELSNGELKGYPSFGRESRDTIYFKGMYLRLIRALEFLTAQPQWDGRILVVTGVSQGGGQSIAAAGLDPRVTAIAAGVPALCDHSGPAIGRTAGWPKIVPLTDKKPDPKVLLAARYIDAMNFATRTRADALFSVGFIDTVCPATSIYATYNNLPGKKEMIIEPLMGHAHPESIRKRFEAYIDDHVRRRQGK